MFTSDGENERLVSSYLYTPEGELKAEVSHGDESWIKVYEYKNGQISVIKQFKTNAEIESSERIELENRINTLLASACEEVYVQQFKYTRQNENRKILTLVNGLGKESVSEYDSHGNLVKTTSGVFFDSRFYRGVRF